MKRAIIYSRAGNLYLVTSSRTVSMLWVHDGEYSVLKAANIGAAELGESVMGHVDRSRQGIPEPDVRAADRTLPRLAGERSWAAFYQDTKLAEVNQDGDHVVIAPLISPKGERGFIPDEENAAEMDASTSYEELGNALFRMLS